MKLTSVKMQAVIFGEKYDETWYTPMLRFGRGNNALRQVPIYIKEESLKIKECADAFRAFIGKSIDDIKEKHDELVDKFNEHPVYGKQKNQQQ